jgi:hypothetical protein
MTISREFTTHEQRQRHITRRPPYQEDWVQRLPSLGLLPRLWQGGPDVTGSIYK